MSRNFFVSYTHQDKAQAVWLAETLIKRGFTVHFQEWESLPGVNFVSWMNEALRDSENFIALWSQAYTDSFYAKLERETALTELANGRMKLFVVARIERVNVDTIFQPYVRVNLFDCDEAEQERRLIRAVSHKDVSSIFITRRWGARFVALALILSLFAAVSMGWKLETPSWILTASYEASLRKGNYKKATQTAREMRRLGYIDAKRLGAYLTEIAQTVMDADGAPENESMETAESLLQEALNLGDKNALSALSELYAIAPDYEKAIEYCEKAAAQGQTWAMVYLGVIYLGATDVERDVPKALRYLNRAAALGDAIAQNALGTLYYEGDVIEQDYQKAKNYYESAAALGSAEALRNLGSFYAQGLACPRDLDKAISYYTQAAEQNDAESYFYLGSLYEEGWESGDEFVPPDYQKAFSYYERASDLGHPMACYSLGFLYFMGDGVTRDFRKAALYFEKAGELGVKEAYWSLGMISQEGLIGKQDFKKAVFYYEKGAELGDEDALRALGDIYQEGAGDIQADEKKAAEYYQKAQAIAQENQIGD